ncbi:MAG: hypothetical protein AAF591_20320 [Verrucomicrobiota bacterium]
MKNFRIKPLLVTSTMALFLTSALFAEERDHEAIPEPTEAQILAFYRKHIPIALESLNEAKEGKREQSYAKALQDAAHLYVSYHEMVRDDEKEMAGFFVVEVRVNLEIDALLHRFHDGDLSESERKVTKEKLREKLAEQLANTINIHRTEAKMLKQELTQIENTLKRLESGGKALLDKTLQEVLHGEDAERENGEEASGE